MKQPRLNVAVTVDVEEEGLFSGSYSSGPTSVSNVKHLWRLDSVFRDHGVKPTLLVSYQVARDGECRKTLITLRDRWNAEIGAHLHHWNTDPVVQLNHRQPIPSELIPRDILRSKIDNLGNELLSFCGVGPVSFRMGRFNLGPGMFSVVEEMGFRVDSSIEPLRSEYGGPDHLVAPAEPYYPDPSDPVRKGHSRVLEAPITINPIFGGAGDILERARARGLLSNDKLMSIASSLFSIPAQPAWVGLNAAKAGVMFHRIKGGRFLTIFFHSSELAPGMNPLHPTEDSVQLFLRKLKHFLVWLSDRYDARFVTLSEYPEIFDQT